MRMVDLIVHKREGNEHTAAEIEEIVHGFTTGTIPDYQMSAWLMAVCWRGLSRAETGALTRAMLQSGEQIDLSIIPGRKADKHSTGGVGDKTTLVLIPLVAAAGVPVAKMSGRGLGHTGGTVDKLSAIPGFQTDLPVERFYQQVEQVGAAVAAQTGNLVPADKKMYALRDVTGTVESIPLIAASVMSKKLAAGADVIVLDVKVGRGAFMKDRESARQLAGLMVQIGQDMGRTTVAYLTAMQEPLGYAVGNALEVEEAISTLQGQGPGDLRELCLILGAEMLYQVGKAESIGQARQLLQSLLDSGRALDKLQEIIIAQGGNPQVLENVALLPRAAGQHTYTAPRSGWLDIDALLVGQAAMLLGAGRATKDDQIDLAAGIKLLAKTGTPVEAGQPLAVLHHNDLTRLASALPVLEQGIKILDRPLKPEPLIIDRITGGE
ncbi:MAG: thymidine phosphorylase [Bacillota bacterium]|uniref:thymidine phosphorylase n=1 Tax=Desulfurispora thermophila TaxID=265470 RepID=UPI000364C92F|nr:thymidine phosphorylase [Desulfurispora thermophila]